MEPSSSLPLPLQSGIVLRPAYLVVPTTTATTPVEIPRAPFRVSRAMEALLEHSHDFIGARVTTALLLLLPSSSSLADIEGRSEENEAEAEASAERLLSSWSANVERGTKANLAAHLLLSLISVCTLATART